MLKYPLKDMDTDETSWSLKIPHCLPNHVAILIVFFPQKNPRVGLWNTDPGWRPAGFTIVTLR